MEELYLSWVRGSRFARFAVRRFAGSGVRGSRFGGRLLQMWLPALAGRAGTVAASWITSRSLPPEGGSHAAPGPDLPELPGADPDRVAAGGERAGAALELGQRHFHGFAGFELEARIDVSGRCALAVPPVERGRPQVASRLELDGQPVAGRRGGDMPRTSSDSCILGNGVEVERDLPMGQSTHAHGLRAFSAPGHALDQPQVDADETPLETFVRRIFDGNAQPDTAQLDLLAAIVPNQGTDGRCSCPAAR